MSLERSQQKRIRLPKWIPGKWYDVRNYLGGSPSTGAITADMLTSSPIWVPPGGSIDRIGINVTVAAAAGKLARLLLYAPGDNDQPGALLLDGGTVAVDTTGDKTVTVAYTPPSGLIYAAVVSDGTPTLQIATTTGMIVPNGFATPTASNGEGGPSRVGAGLAASDPYGAVTYLTATYYRIAVRAA